MLEDVVHAVSHSVGSDLEADSEQSLTLVVQRVLEVAAKEQSSMEVNAEHRDELNHSSLIFADYAVREEEDACYQSVGLYEEAVLGRPCPIGAKGMKDQDALRPPGIPIQLQ